MKIIKTQKLIEKEKKRLKRYWKKVYPKDYADELVENLPHSSLKPT